MGHFPSLASLPLAQPTLAFLSFFSCINSHCFPLGSNVTSLENASVATQTVLGPTASPTHSPSQFFFKGYIIIGKYIFL